jgi:hypothetical protein
MPLSASEPVVQAVPIDLPLPFGLPSGSPQGGRPRVVVDPMASRRRREVQLVRSTGQPTRRLAEPERQGVSSRGISKRKAPKAGSVSKGVCELCNSPKRGFGVGYCPNKDCRSTSTLLVRY